MNLSDEHNHDASTMLSKWAKFEGEGPLQLFLVSLCTPYPIARSNHFKGSLLSRSFVTFVANILLRLHELIDQILN